MSHLMIRKKVFPILLFNELLINRFIELNYRYGSRKI
jgi:hypothetical protein